MIDRPGEDLFAFVRDLSATGYRHARDRSARPSPEEVDLTRGWAVIAGKELAEAAQRFRNYLRDAMGADVKEGAAPNVIRLHIDGERVNSHLTHGSPVG